MNLPNRLLIRGGRLLTPEREIAGDLLINGSQITHVGSFCASDEEGIRVIDAAGLYVAPGFIDVHIQGTLNRDVWEVETDGVAGLAGALPQFGCTGFLLTTHYDATHLPRLIERTRANPDGARIFGFHFEGPFVSPKKHGALTAQTQVPITVAGLQTVYDQCDGLLKMMTLAPELPNGLDMVKFLSEKGVIPSLGHSDASYEIAVEAVKRGLCHATHCFNAMRPMTHREPGSVGACLLCDEISIQIVSDNKHLHPAIYSLVSRVKPWDKIIVVTDAVRAAGMPDGTFSSDGHGDIILKNETVMLPDGTIAGSAITMNKAIRNFRNQVGCSMAKAVQLATINQASLIGCADRVGRLEPGYLADVVLLNEEFEIHKTILNGKVAFERE